MVKRDKRYITGIGCLPIIVLLFITLSLIPNFGFGQSTINENFQVFNGESAKSVIETDNAYYVAGIGTNTYPNNLCYLYVNKLTKDGTLINQIKLADINTSTFSAWTCFNGAMKITHDNSIIICGSVTNSEGTSGLIVKLTANLDTLWSKKYSGPIYSIQSSGTYQSFLILTHIEEAIDSGFIVCGYYQDSTDPFDDRIVVIKTDSYGNELWRKSIGNHGEPNRSFDFTIMPDKGFLIAGMIYGLPTNTLIKTDSLGNQKWYKKIGGPLPDPIVHSVLISNDNNIVFCCQHTYKIDTYFGFYQYYYNISVAKLNISGETIWERNYFMNKSFNTFSPDQNISMTESPSGDLLIGGTTYIEDSLIISEPGYQGGLLKLNSSGDSLWCNFYHLPNNDESSYQIYDLINTKDKGILFVGDFYSKTTQQSSWVVKTDSLGFVQGSYLKEMVPKIENPSMFYLYPNPTHDLLKINCTLAIYNNNLEFNIYNSLGEKILSKKCQNLLNEIDFDVRDFVNGVYFLEIKSGNEVYSVRKFIKY